jgi:hypothetical protein
MFRPRITQTALATTLVAISLLPLQAAAQAAKAVLSEASS